jgi:hypothetical protein
MTEYQLAKRIEQLTATSKQLKSRLERSRRQAREAEITIDMLRSRLEHAEKALAGSQKQLKQQKNQRSAEEEPRGDLSPGSLWGRYWKRKGKRR